MTADFMLSVSLREVPPHPEVTHVAIGVFDGFHCGHRQVISRLIHEAAHAGATAIVTFEPHPLQLIAPERAPRRLTNAKQKRALLVRAGVAEVFTLAFDEDVRRLDAAGFVAELLRVFPNLRAIGMGPNWSFGRDRAGNAAVLTAIGREKGFVVHEVPPLIIEGEIASSTRIREAVGAGDFALAAMLLGRPYAFAGKVTHGDGRGRTLGFPTANLEVTFQMLPPLGVYACRVKLPEGVVVRAVLNIGHRPTVNAGFSVEAHLLGFSGDLYGQELELGEFRFLRGERKFDSVEALRYQIAQDIASCG